MHLSIALGLAALAVAAAPADEPAKKTANIAVIKIKGELSETPAAPGLFGEMQTGLRSVVDRIRKAGADDKIQAVHLELEAGVGRGQVNELRQAIQAVRKAGKRVYASFESGSPAITSSPAPPMRSSCPPPPC